MDFHPYRVEPDTLNESAFDAGETLDSACKIMPYQEKDLAGVLLLLQQLWPTRNLDVPRIESTLLEGMRSTQNAYFVTKIGPRIAGFASLSWNLNLWQMGYLAHIDELVVDARYHKRGLGRQLLDHLSQVAIDKGCARIELDTAFHRTEAHRFYEKYGFESRGLVFTKELPASAFNG
jgi:glucosamine-phosphate N-acetyltransferase